ncbi:MAG: imidazole glycerol phosphate synthase subunit HisH [Opitutaceae bacterium]|nr:imidazole glycerol phosphate synthase subunit HisH [Opitutaceae bacterium]
MALKIALINYGMGNLKSVSKALESVGAQVEVVTDASAFEGADGVVLPGVGALGDCVEALKLAGFDGAIREWIQSERPFLGVCLGLQALFETSEEGDVSGLGIFPGRVVRFERPKEYKIPHMGWNQVRFEQEESPLLRGLTSGEDQFYFVHSYYVVPEDSSLILMTTDYGGRFVSAIGKGNCFATQFHPEKSQAKGLRLYRNFVELCMNSG